MIDGLKLTFSGDELRELLDTRADGHEAHARWWAHEEARTPEEQTEEAPLLPDHICRNEAERHAWRSEVLRFIRDHIAAGETYRIGAADLDFGELLPPKPSGHDQVEFEERNRVGFGVERLAKGIERLAASAADAADRLIDCRGGIRTPGIIEETDEFRTTRVDTGQDGPEIIMVQRK